MSLLFKDCKPLYEDSETSLAYLCDLSEGEDVADGLHLVELGRDV